MGILVREIELLHENFIRLASLFTLTGKIAAALKRRIKLLSSNRNFLFLFFYVAIQLFYETFLIRE